MFVWHIRSPQPPLFSLFYIFWLPAAISAMTTTSGYLTINLYLSCNMQLAQTQYTDAFEGRIVLLRWGIFNLIVATESFDLYDTDISVRINYNCPIYSLRVLLLATESTALGLTLCHDHFFFYNYAAGYDYQSISLIWWIVVIYPTNLNVHIPCVWIYFNMYMNYAIYSIWLD